MSKINSYSMKVVLIHLLSTYKSTKYQAKMCFINIGLITLICGKIRIFVLSYLVDKAGIVRQ